MPAAKHVVFFAFFLIGSLCLTSSSVAHIKAADISFASVELVDYRDQQERPAPRPNGLEELIGLPPADQATSIMASKELKDASRLLLRVDFLSTVDLQAIANRDAIVFLHSYFCLHQNDFAVLSAPTVYLDGRPIHANQGAAASSSRIPGQQFKYSFYLNAVRRENRNSKPPQNGFDLRVTPENVCFYVTGSGPLGLIYTSSTAVVPKDAIAGAINQLAP